MSRWQSVLEARTQVLKAEARWREPDANPRRTPAQEAPGASPVDVTSNDYLGLAERSRGVSASVPIGGEYSGRHPGIGSGGGALVGAALGAGSARLVRGTHPEHRALERELAAWLELEDSLVFSSGYAANVGLISALAGPGDVVISDALNHASIIDGCRLSRASVRVVAHRDVTAIGRLVEEAAAQDRACWVVTESYFSMDGNGPDLARLHALCREHEAALIVDEAHALGVFGAEGRGLCAAAGFVPDVLVGGLGKAFGGQGGFVASSTAVRGWLWNRARSFVFSTGVSPQLSAAMRVQLERVRGADEERRHLAALGRALRERLLGAGLRLPEGQHGPLVPVIVGGELPTLDAAAALRAAGFHVQPIRPPTVPVGESRLRISLHAGLSTADVVGLGEAVVEVLARLGATGGGRDGVGAERPASSSGASADERRERAASGGGSSELAGRATGERAEREALGLSAEGRTGAGVAAPAEAASGPRRASAQGSRVGSPDDAGAALGRSGAAGSGAGARATRAERSSEERVTLGAAGGAHPGQPGERALEAGAPASARAARGAAGDPGPSSLPAPAQEGLAGPAAVQSARDSAEGAPANGALSGSPEGVERDAAARQAPAPGLRGLSGGGLGASGGGNEALADARRALESAREAGAGVLGGARANRMGHAGFRASTDPSGQRGGDAAGDPQDGEGGAEAGLARAPGLLTRLAAGDAVPPRRPAALRGEGEDMELRGGEELVDGDAALGDGSVAPGEGGRARAGGSAERHLGASAGRLDGTQAALDADNEARGSATAQLPAMAVVAAEDPRAAAAAQEALEAPRPAGIVATRGALDFARATATGVRPVASGPRRWVVLGAGTGVGKTFVTTGLARALGGGGAVLAAVKPIETGLTALGDRPPPGSDAAELERVSFHVKHTPQHPLFRFTAPLTPALAARREGRRIELGAVLPWLAQWTSHEGNAPDEMVVETAGGVFSPISPAETNLELAMLLEPSLWVLVAADRLGVLHELGATLRAMAVSARLPDYVVLSAPAVADESTGTNAEELAALGFEVPIITLGRDQQAPLEALVRSRAALGGV